MKINCTKHYVDAMEPANSKLCDPSRSESGFDASYQEPLLEDERYPGTFFRIPGIPVPGKTGWRLTS